MSPSFALPLGCGSHCLGRQNTEHLQTVFTLRCCRRVLGFREIPRHGLRCGRLKLGSLTPGYPVAAGVPHRVRNEGSGLFRASGLRVTMNLGLGKWGTPV